jgi:hypothetical protein
MADNNHEELLWQDIPYVLHPRPVDTLFVVHRRRASSAPPSVPITRARDSQNGTEKEPANKNWTSKIGSSAGAEKQSCSHFYHPNFEVIARDIPEDKVQELKRVLVAFASSLEIGRRALPRITDKCQVRSCDVTESENPRRAFTFTQHISEVTNAETPYNRHGSEGGWSLRHTRCLSFAAAAPSVYARPRRATDKGLLQDFAPKTEAVMPLNDPTCDTTSHRWGSHNDKHESDSGSSIDFLHLARQTDPDAVRLLEDEHDRMMTDAG